MEEKYIKYTKHMKLIVLSESDNYSVSSLIRNLIKMFYDESIIKIFEERGIEIITSKYIKEVLNKTEIEFLEQIEDKKDFIIFGIHPNGWLPAIQFGKDIKKVMWQDDLHYFANFINRNELSVQKFSEKYDPFYIKDVDYVITPSSIYFKNLGINDYDEKIIDFFYFLDEKKYTLIDYDYHKRTNGIVLSGAIYHGYESRMEFDKLRKTDLFKDLIYKIEHPGYENNEHMTELNYYNEISKYKGAFVGHHAFPIDFLLAKHIEVLMCGCLGFFEPNPLLKEQLGLIEYVHYIPCFDENGLIKDDSFYRKWIESDEGYMIAKKGKEYVRDKFGKEYIKKLADFFTSIS
jgi:hypothetical protein